MLEIQVNPNNLVHYADIGFELLHSARKNDPGTEWSLSQTGDALDRGGLGGDLSNSIRLNLMNALPVPAADVPLCDIEEFRLKHAADIEALHDSIDGLYLEILASPDPSIAERRAIRRLGEVLATLDAYMQENKWSIFKASMSPAYKVAGDLTAFTLATGATATVLGIPIDILNAIGVGASLAGLKFNIEETPDVPIYNNAASKNILNVLSKAKKDQILE